MRSRVTIAGRLAALVLLAAGLALPHPGGAPGRSALTVVIDDGRAAAAVRAQLARDLEGWDGRLRVVVPGASPAGGAALERMLEEALWQLEPAARNAVLVASGGEWSAGVAPLLARAAAAGIPLFWLPLDSRAAGPRIRSIAAAGRVRAGGTITALAVTDPLPPGHALALYGNGERLAQGPADTGGRSVLRVAVPAGGAVRLDAALLDPAGAVVDELTGGAIVNVSGPPRLLLLTDGPSALGDALGAGGWPVRRVSTGAFPALADTLSAYSALIVDDVAATALPESSWRAIEEAVRREALGLLVLGGPRSFGLGAYRGSVLETLLPLVSEPPEREQPAAVLFLVDVSGSMGRQANERLRVAREAVAFTARSLRPGDRVGLTVFDVEARPLLPLAAREDHAAALAAAWPARGSGGTRLAGALGQGLEALAAERARQKLLVLVSDGQLPAADVAFLGAQLEGGGIELVALVLAGPGDGATPLSALDGSGNATILPVGDVLRLPELMRGQVESQRAALAGGPGAVVVASVPPFLDATEWPALDAWLVTRPRPAARVMLAAESGDPLLASWTAGAGRVVALPGGLGGWSAGWLAWERWPELAAGLAGYVALRDPGVVRIRRAPGSGDEPAWLLDTGGAAAPERLHASADHGDAVALAPVPVGPGLWRIAWPAAPRSGAVTLSWQDEHNVFRHTVAAAPPPPAPATADSATTAVAAGLVHPWTKAAAARLSPTLSARPAVLFLALLTFLAALVGSGQRKGLPIGK